MKQEKIEITIIDSLEIDDVGPPPHDFTNRYRTLQEWLFSICDEKGPQKSIQTFCFGLFEGQGGYTVFLVGTNKYEVDKNRTVIKIDFEPEDTYFNLSKKEYKTLEREQVQERLTVRLKELFKTVKFQQSFLSKANAIITEWNGTTIWTK
ncbi:MAG: hypothetical protein ACXVLT_01630 [Flavisolibacter sp.]